MVYKTTRLTILAHVLKFVFHLFLNTMMLTSQYPITFPSENPQYSLSVQWDM